MSSVTNRQPLADPDFSATAPAPGPVTLWGPFDPSVPGWWLPAEDYWWERGNEFAADVVRMHRGWVYSHLSGLWSPCTEEP